MTRERTDVEKLCRRVLREKTNPAKNLPGQTGNTIAMAQ